MSFLSPFTLGLGSTCSSHSVSHNSVAFSHLVCSPSLGQDQESRVFFLRAKGVPSMSNWLWSGLDMGSGSKAEEGGWSGKMKGDNFFFPIEPNTLRLSVQLLFFTSSTSRNANSKPKVADYKPKMKRGQVSVLCSPFPFSSFPLSL